MYAPQQLSHGCAHNTRPSVSRKKSPGLKNRQERLSHGCAQNARPSVSGKNIPRPQQQAEEAGRLPRDQDQRGTGRLPSRDGVHELLRPGAHRNVPYLQRRPAGKTVRVRVSAHASQSSSDDHVPESTDTLHE